MAPSPRKGWCIRPDARYRAPRDFHGLYVLVAAWTDRKERRGPERGQSKQRGVTRLEWFALSTDVKHDIVPGPAVRWERWAAASPMVENMKVLFLTQLLPYPLDSGGKIKSYHFLKALSKKHDVTLLSFVRSNEKLEHIAHMKRICRRVETILLRRSRAEDAKCLVKSWLTNRSFVIARDWSTEFQWRLNDLLSKDRFDVIHAVRPNMFQFVPDGHLAHRVLDTENVEAHIVRRLFESSRLTVAGLLSLFEFKRLSAYEKMACRKADLVLTVTENDKAALSGLTAGLSGGSECAPIETIPIGVDTEYFGYSWQPDPEPRSVFVGTMYWPPNVDCVTRYCRDILPLIRKSAPALQFDIVGLRPARTVIELGRRTLGVQVCGSVKDVRPYMSRSRVFVVPLRAGSGMRVKILNAMATGVPVVTTSIGCEGIDGLVTVRTPTDLKSNPEANIWVADSSETFAEAVARLTKDDELATRLSRNGRKLMEERYDWRIISQRLLDLYDRIEADLKKRNAAVV